MTAVQPAPPAAAPVTGRRERARARRLPRKRRRTAPAHPSRIWVGRRFRAALALSAAVLLPHAHVVGHGAPTMLGGFAHGLLEATSSSGTAVVVAFAILLVAAWCFRRVRLEQ